MYTQTCPTHHLRSSRRNFFFLPFLVSWTHLLITWIQSIFFVSFSLSPSVSSISPGPSRSIHISFSIFTEISLVGKKINWIRNECTAQLTQNVFEKQKKKHFIGGEKKKTDPYMKDTKRKMIHRTKLIKWKINWEIYSFFWTPTISCIVCEWMNELCGTFCTFFSKVGFVKIRISFKASLAPLRIQSQMMKILLPFKMADVQRHCDNDAPYSTIRMAYSLSIMNQSREHFYSNSFLQQFLVRLWCWVHHQTTLDTCRP